MKRPSMLVLEGVIHATSALLAGEELEDESGREGIEAADEWARTTREDVLRGKRGRSRRRATTRRSEG